MAHLFREAVFAVERSDHSNTGTDKNADTIQEHIPGLNRPMIHQMFYELGTPAKGKHQQNEDSAQQGQANARDKGKGKHAESEQMNPGVQTALCVKRKFILRGKTAHNCHCQKQTQGKQEIPTFRNA